MIKKLSLIISIVGILAVILLINIVNKHENAIGGSAMDGKIENNKYYLSVGTSEYKEINKSTWHLSRVLWIIMFISSVVTMIAVLIASLIWVVIPTLKRMFF